MPFESPNFEKPKETLPVNEAEARRQEADKLWSVIEMLRLQFAQDQDTEKLQRGLKLLEDAIRERRSISLMRMSPQGAVQIVSGERQPWQDQDGNIHRLGEKTEKQ